MSKSLGQRNEPTLRDQVLAVQRRQADLLARSTDLLIRAVGNVESLSDDALARLRRGFR